MTHQRTAIVIGGGLIGCTSAYYLARLGWQVSLLERDRVGSGASHGNCGYVCPSHALPLSGPGVIGHTLPTLLKTDAPLAIPPRFDPGLWKWLVQFSRQCTEERMMRAARGRHALLQSSMQLYRELVATESMDCEWTDQGLLLVFRSQADFDGYAKTAARLQREFAIESVAYPGEEVTKLEPALRSGMAGGWHFPGDAHVRPDKLMAGLKAALLKHQVQIQEHVEVQGLTVSDGRLTGLETSAGRRSADWYVLATGAEAPRFAKAVGCRIPIQPGKGYSLTFGPLPEGPRIPMIFEEHHVAVTPFAGAFRVGSTMEFTGYDRSLNRKRLGLLRTSAAQHLRQPLPELLTEEWCGWRPMVYDGLPCIGRSVAAHNLLIAAGNGMIGLATAPATGKLIAELASGTEPHLDPAPYAPGRFR